MSMDRLPAPKRFGTTLSLKASRKPDPVPESPAPVAASPPAKPKKQKAVAAGQPTAPKQAKPPHQPPYQPRTSDDAATQLAEWLGQHSAVWRDFQPLNIGVISEVYALLAVHDLHGTYSKRVIHKALHWHTSRTQYWDALLASPERYGLDGSVGGEVTQAQRDYAKQQREGRVATVWDKRKHKKG